MLIGNLLEFMMIVLLQGYRDANCLFIEMLVNEDSASTSTSYREYEKSDYCLCLAIHAPKKGIIEVVVASLSSFRVGSLRQNTTELIGAEL